MAPVSFGRSPCQGHGYLLIPLTIVLSVVVVEDKVEVRAAALAAGVEVVTTVMLLIGPVSVLKPASRNEVPAERDWADMGFSESAVRTEEATVRK